jgi:hypothetical protein
MGNTAVLKPSLTAVHETYLMMKIWREAGGCSAAGAAARYCGAHLGPYTSAL